MNDLDRQTAAMYASWFRPLADPTRLLVLNLLATREEPMTVGEIVDALDVGQPTVSQHLKVLSEACFVQVEPVGTRRYYRINPNCLERFPTAAAVIMGRVERVAAPAPTQPPWATTG
jgi:DNA-binding transcriptional ArsR family regulator